MAALFALHPLHVESVAWVAERKDVLSTFFGLLSIGAYAAHVKAEGRMQNVERKAQHRVFPFTFHVSGYYLLSLLLFALSLMSKPMLVTLPLLLVLLDYWPLNRFQLHPQHLRLKTCLPLLREKLPYLALAAVSSAITVVVQKQGHALLSVEAIPIGPRIGNAVVSYARYIGKSLWPSHLALPYPYPNGWPLAVVALAALLVVGLSWGALWLARSRPYVVVGWFWFVGTLVPVIGLVQVGSQAMADRYTYIPLVGLFILVAWLVSDWLRNWRYRQVALGTAGAAVILLCLGRARVQAGYWKDSETLFRHALRVTRDNYVAHDNLGDALADHGKREDGPGGVYRRHQDQAGVRSRLFQPGKARLRRGQIRRRRRLVQKGPGTESGQCRDPLQPGGSPGEPEPAGRSHRPLPGSHSPPARSLSGAQRSPACC